MENTFRKLIQRHESFRTSFEMVEGEPVQRIHKEIHFKIEDSIPGGAPSETLPESTIEHFIRPFDLSKPLLLRVGLIKLEEEKHIFILDTHHIITDGFSKDILTRDFLSLYSGEVSEPLKLQYKDFSEWQNSTVQQASIKNQQIYWTDLFKDEVPVLNLPFDYPRPAIQSFEGDVLRFFLDKEKTGGLRKLAAKVDVTVFMALLGVFYVFLWKLGGQEDIVVGTPIIGRRHPELGPIIGMFVNTLAIRNLFFFYHHQYL